MKHDYAKQRSTVWPKCLCGAPMETIRDHNGYFRMNLCLNSKCGRVDEMVEPSALLDDLLLQCSPANPCVFCSDLGVEVGRVNSRSDDTISYIECDGCGNNTETNFNMQCQLYGQQIVLFIECNQCKTEFTYSGYAWERDDKRYRSDRRSRRGRHNRRNGGSNSKSIVTKDKNNTGFMQKLLNEVLEIINVISGKHIKEPTIGGTIGLILRECYGVLTYVLGLKAQYMPGDPAFNNAVLSRIGQALSVICPFVGTFIGKMFGVAGGGAIGSFLAMAIIHGLNWIANSSLMNRILPAALTG